MSTERKLHLIDISITLIAPWLVHGNDPGKFGLDATLMRDHTGKPILPGSLIQGRLRHAWTEMKEAFGLSEPNANDWFGTASTEFDKRGRVIINDLAMANAPDELLMNTRVPIDAETGAAKQGMLVMMEQICPPGTEVTFSGQWRAWATDKDAETLKKSIQAGLNWQSQLGAQRSVGFGKVQNVTVNLSKAPESGNTAATLQGNTLRLSLCFDQPICVGASSVRGNVFVSDDKISGGTIKGAIATLLHQRYGETVAALEKSPKLAKHFDALRITHAFPSKDEKRPSAIPFSLASVDKEIYDLSSIKEPSLINGQSPTFFHDWKEEVWQRVSEEQKSGNTTTHLRVRTAIDPDLRTAKDSQLFAYECRVADKGTRWLADISIPETDREGVIKELTILLQHGLGPIGKTDAWASVELSTNQANVRPLEVVAGDTVRMQLNTPALLIAASEVGNQTNPDLHKMYTAIFNQISDDSLTLSHYYACHSMSGGAFLHQKKGQKENYQPFVLTDAGSVFVFTVNDQKTAKTKLQEWQTQGLPLPDCVVKAHGIDWNTNPYLPQNGFGEIAINLQHGFKQPQPEQLSAVESY